jgi:hypothetical protein
LRDIDFAILVHSLRLLDNLEEGAGNTSGPPELWAAIIGGICVGGTSLDPVTFLATTVADVAGWWRLVRDCCLLGEKWSVVDTLTIVMLVLC